MVYNDVFIDNEMLMIFVIMFKVFFWFLGEVWFFGNGLYWCLFWYKWYDVGGEDCLWDVFLLGGGGGVFGFL